LNIDFYENNNQGKHYQNDAQTTIANQKNIKPFFKETVTREFEGGVRFGIAG
jgi:hypothetical protein